MRETTGINIVVELFDLVSLSFCRSIAVVIVRCAEIEIHCWDVLFNGFTYPKKHFEYRFGNVRLILFSFQVLGLVIVDTNFCFLQVRVWLGSVLLLLVEPLKFFLVRFLI